MDLIGEKIGEMIGQRGDNDDQNDEENLRFNPLRFAGKRGLWRSIYDNDKRGFNPKQIKDLIGEKIGELLNENKRGTLYEHLRFNPVRFVEKRFNPSQFAGYGNRRIRSIWPVQSARFGETDIVCQNLPELPFVRTVRVGSADFARPIFL